MFITIAVHVAYSYFTYQQTLGLSSLESLVIDEADLILSYGHDEDVRQIFGGGYLPTIYQSFLMSATMTDDVETLKGLALRNPVRSSFCSPLVSHPFSSGHIEIRRRRRRCTFAESILCAVCRTSIWFYHYRSHYS